MLENLFDTRSGKINNLTLFRFKFKKRGSETGFLAKNVDKLLDKDKNLDRK